MILPYELDLDILPLDLHDEIQVRTSVHSTVRVVTAHRQTRDVKTITLDTLQMWDLMIQLTRGSLTSRTP